MPDLLDMPDNYPWLPGSGKAQLGDLGELAVRLGSPISYDRRGVVYWYDDFEDGLSPWFPNSGGAGANVRFTHKYVFRGSLCAKLTAGSDEDLIASIVKRLAPALLSTYGIEATISVEEHVDLIVLGIQYNTGAKRYRGRLIVNITDQTIEYFDEEGDFIVIDTLDIEADDPYLYNTLKLVVDLERGEFLRALFNQNSYSLKDIPLDIQDDTTIPRIEASVTILSNDGFNGTAYVDSVIVTVGDP